VFHFVVGVYDMVVLVVEVYPIECGEDLPANELEGALNVHLDVVD
jgi:hypothetical protein